MTCAELRERLDDDLDGSLSEGEFQEIELHLAACAACREAERGQRALLAEAAGLPRELPPPRDLWPGIAERIALERVVAGPAVFPAPPRPFWRRPAALAAAAAVAIALAAALARPPLPSPRPRAGVEPPPAPAARVSLQPASVQEAEAEYARVTAALLAAVDARRATLPPETLRLVDENLRIIDRALAELRDALHRNPGNPDLVHMLRATHQRKLEVLRRVMQLKA